MVKLVKGLMLVCLAGSMVACTTSDNRKNLFNGGECGTTNVRPVAQPVYQATASNGCQSSEYTVRTPVEVIYKNTTYRTVYVPQVSQSVAYEKRPYNYNEVCANGNCTSNQ